MDREDLKTAKEIELVESGSKANAEKIQNKLDASFDSRSIEDTVSSNHAEEETLSLNESDAGPLDTKGAIRTSGEEDRLVGKIIGGHYEILSLIGQGGMSLVYKAKHLLLKRNVAIKLLTVGRQFDKKAIARFQTEAESAAGLQHLNICSTREFGINEEGIPFLVMDYVEGTSLGDTLFEEKKLSREKSIEIMTELCAGLEHAHAQGVIHRDIKPANIILAKNKSGGETVKIVDFGIAKLIREDEAGPNLTQTGEVFGTPKYMSPEQCLGSRVDQRADIYALGCIFYEMLSGHPPFCDESSIQILFAHVNNEPASLSQSCGKQIQAILDRCLKKDVSQRYQNASQLLADLKALKSGSSLVHARPQGVQPKTLIAVGTLAALICVFIFVFTSMSQGRKSTAEYTKTWKAMHEEAATYKAHDLPAAERLLEESLKIAKESRSESIIALTLQELSDVEGAQGKTSEAEEHRKALESRIKFGDLPKFFLQIAFLLICVGLALMIFILVVFGKKQTSLQDIFSRKK